MALPMKHDPKLGKTRRRLKKEIAEQTDEMGEYELTLEGRERIIK